MLAPGIADTELQAIWEARVPYLPWDPDPSWWAPRDVARIGAMPAMAVQAERSRILKRHSLTRPIVEAWHGCSIKEPCRTPHCSRCNGPDGVVQIELRKRIDKFFAAIPRSSIEIVSHHLKPVLIDPDDILGSVDVLAREVRLVRQNLIKRLQRYAPRARVFCAIECEPKRVRDVPAGIYPNSAWGLKFRADDIVALVHVHAVVYDPDREMGRVWSPPYGRRPGSRQTRISLFRPMSQRLDVDDGVGYAAGYGLKRRLGWDFGSDSEALFVIWSAVFDIIKISELCFFSGGKRKDRRKTLSTESASRSNLSDEHLLNTVAISSIKTTESYRFRDEELLFDSGPESSIWKKRLLICCPILGPVLGEQISLLDDLIS